ncbi:hypothetical protein [Ruegeria conchae]|uniref:Uncharacterized protein n=1 Tax=Ruegeria conchae TaxID=981384 RepID=A0A497YNV9_9RHOB|nr:hypothetical protein [Ruegeria conchae]RLJ97600.1 hypothetical protein CLV75_4397 [Ruegeria conchae]
MNWLSTLFTSFLLAAPLSAMADWQFSSGPSPNAFIQANNITLELQCDRIRFAPAGYEDSQDIVNKQGLSFCFMSNGTAEVGAFQAERANSSFRVVDNYPVEIEFNDANDYVFVLDQIAANATLNLSMTDQDISYAILELKGSSAAIRSLKRSCSNLASSGSGSRPEAPEGVVYCGGGGTQRQIEYAIVDTGSDWDARVTVNGETMDAMTSYSYFGNAEPPRGFIVALLGQDRSEFLVFEDGSERWIEFGDYRYDQCN